jgi:SAM-dependent methyltransferase
MSTTISNFIDTYLPVEGKKGQQTFAEKYLIQSLVREIQDRKSASGNSPHIINIGASRKIFFENTLSNAGCDFTTDRVDIDDCKVLHQSVNQCWQCSVESMHPVDSKQYDLAFASWVLEHVSNLKNASQEIFRILKPAGKFIASIPNPKAPEFFLSKRTPLRFHKVIRGKAANAWETHYNYRNIKELVDIFNQAGFRKVEIKYFPATKYYLSKFPVFNVLSKFYDRFINYLKIRPIMGHVCLVLEKPSF